VIAQQCPAQRILPLRQPHRGEVVSGLVGHVGAQLDDGGVEVLSCAARVDVPECAGIRHEERLHVLERLQDAALFCSHSTIL